MKTPKKPTKLVFITGTDTGAGKTLLTALLLHNQRKNGVSALAMKPFCSGGLSDVKLLNSLQNQALSRDLINPFYFAEPVAPLVSARQHGRKIAMKAVLTSINRIKKRCKVLLIEGSGGILVPLGEGFSVRELIQKLRCPVIVAARNRLGVINQVRLTIECIQAIGIKQITIVLMDCREADHSAKTNAKIIAELAPKTTVFSVPYLGENATSKGGVKKGSKKIKKTIALIGESANLSVF